MKKIYHLCLSSASEVICRSEADQRRCFNCFADSVFQTDSRALASGIMTTHFHHAILSDNPAALMHACRYSYARYFNAKYGRRGRLGEKYYFLLEMDGVRHITAGLTYVLRQGLHHGLAATPFGYEFSSSNSVFRKELGKTNIPDLISPDKRYLYLPDRSDVPGDIRMSSDGMLLMEDIIDTGHVEALYVTPRNFLFHMNMITNDQFVRDQQEDKSASRPISLDVIEKGVSDVDLKQMLVNEQGRVNKTMMSDIELCQLIDEKFVPKMVRVDGPESPSPYLLTMAQRQKVANLIWQKFLEARRRKVHGEGGKIITEHQLARCMCLG